MRVNAEARTSIFIFLLCVICAICGSIFFPFIDSSSCLRAFVSNDP